MTASVTAGDVLVVGVIIYSDSVGKVWSPNVYDTVGTPLREVVSFPNYLSSDPFSMFIYVGTVTGSTVNDLVMLESPFPEPFDAPRLFAAIVYDVSGVTTNGAKVDVGNGFGTAISVSGLPFASGAFLLGMIGYDCPADSVDVKDVTISPGPGLALTMNPHGGCWGMDGQFGALPPCCLTTFPATIHNPNGQAWVEVALVLNPSSSTSTVTPMVTTTSTASQTVSTVQSSSASQSVSVSTSQPSTSQSSIQQVTVVQTQTVTQPLSSATSQATSRPGILGILQQNSLPLIGVLGLAVIVLAIAMIGRGKHGSQAAPSR